MTDQNFRYVFSGRVIPERTAVNTSKIPFLLSSENYEGKVEIKIGASQVTAVVTTDSKVENHYTLRNVILSSTTAITDMFAYTHGYSYDVEITTLVTPEGDRVTYPVSIPALKEKIEEEGKKYDQNDLIKLYQNKERYIERALSDFRRSFAHPRDTGFYCYRSIESLKQRFTSWEEFREEVGIGKDQIMQIKEYADQVRHGGIIEITDEERATIYKSTWDILEAYIGYAVEKDLGNNSN